MKTLPGKCQHNGNEANCPVCGQSEDYKPKTLIPSSFTRLQREHQIILGQSRALLKSVQAAARTNSNKSRAGMSRTLQNLARLKKLVTEHQKEEERILIPILNKYLDSNASESMRVQNEEVSVALRQLNAKLTQANSSHQEESRRALFKFASEFDSIAREHFSREENVIYWFASLCLSQQDRHNEI